MKDYKLIQLLSTFSSSEITDFGKFVNSPFHNESQKIINLYSFIKKFHPDFEGTKFTKENAFSSVYGNVKYDDKKLRERFSDLLKLAEEYLSVIAIRKLTCDEEILTLYEYKSRKLPVHFGKKYNEIKSLLDKVKVQDATYLYDLYVLEATKADFFENNLTGKRKSSNEHLEYELDCFIKFFMTRMLMYYTTMSNWAMQSKYKFSYKFYDQIMKFIEENNINNPPIIKAFYLILKFEDEKNNELIYFELKKLLIKEMENFSAFDKVMVGVILYNYAQKRYQEGNEKFAAEQFEMIKLQLKYQIFPALDGYFSREQFLNAILIPVSLNKIEWAEKFTEKYKDKIRPEHREDTLAYARAHLKYSRKKYGNALEELSKIKSIDYIYYFKIKTLQAKIYFEQGDFEKVFSLLDSYKHYIKSNPLIPEENVIRYINLVSVLHKLTMLALKYDEYKLSALIRKINNFSLDEITTNKTWLLEMATDLRGANSK